MSFGYAVSDFVALGQLAWNIYRVCKEARKGSKTLLKKFYFCTLSKRGRRNKFRRTFVCSSAVPSKDC